MTQGKRMERLSVYVDDALDALLEASEGNGGSFTCGEANRIAELFELVGHAGHDQFLLNHAYGDDEGDLHYLCQQCDEGKYADEHGMCESCLHNAKRSGWEPGTEEG